MDLVNYIYVGTHILLNIRAKNRCIKMFKTPFFSRKGVIVSENPIATMNGLEVLKRGGNAVDAAVAVSFSLAVTIPHLGGVGGDFFALIYDGSTGKVNHINGSGYAGKGATIDLMRDKGFSKMPVKGAYSVTVPGLVDALYNMWRRFGSEEWSRLLDKPSKIAYRGFPASHSLSRALNMLGGELAKDPGSRVHYPLNREIHPGDLIKFPALARLLDILREDPRAFYEGDVMEKMVEYINREAPLFSEEDFRSYSSEWLDPIKITFKGFEVYEMPPNTQGISTLQMLHYLEGLTPSEVEPSSSERINLFLKLFKTIFCLRDKYITDPRYMDISISKLLDKEFLKTALKECIYHPTGSGGQDTTYFAVIDDNGTIVSGIQSLFYGFGSKVTEPTYGVTFNCRAHSFSLDEQHINSLAPGKKPMHTLSSPVLVGKDRAYAHGLSGGHYRPQLHSEILTNMLVYGMDPQTALEFPRFVWNIENGGLIIEDGYDLQGLGYKDVEVKSYGSRLGVAATVEYRFDGLRAGYGDIRGDMYPAGLV